MSESALAEAIAASGARVAFGVPGGGANLEMVGALNAHNVQFVLSHTETAACIMASTYGHLTDSISAAVATRGPGVASAVNGAAQATLDRHPLLLVTDTVAQPDRARIAHQRIDQRALMTPVTKWSAALTDTTARAAVTTALAWPPGCVHLDQDTGADDAVPPPMPLPQRANEKSLAAARAAISNASRPLMIVGPGALASAPVVRAQLVDFAAPVLTTYQAVGVVDTESPMNAGLFTGGAAEQPLIAECDLVVLVGVDMVEPIPAPWRSGAPVVSISQTATVEPYAPIAHEVCGDVGDLLGQLLDHADHTWPMGHGANFREHTRARYREAPGGHDAVGAVELVDTAANHFRADPTVTLTVDAGAHFLAIMPLWPVAEPKRLLISNGLATMGYALPAAIGAALARPGQPVVAMVGDGGLGMALAELETLARLELPVTVIVFNDATLSLIRIKQGPDHGGDAAVAYRRTDFAAAARAHGIDGISVSSPNELRDALEHHGPGPLLIDVAVNPAEYEHLIRVTRG